MRAALLRGREHVDLEAVDAIGEGNAAIALSRGGAVKRYPHSEPNEDAAGFACGRVGLFAAVVDGHNGFEASEVALEHVLGEPAAQWTEAPTALELAAWRRQALAALYDANEHVRRELGGGTRSGPRTTVSLTVVLSYEKRLLHAAVGDSHLFLATASEAWELAPAGQEIAFLGATIESTEELGSVARVGVEPLDGIRAVVLVTDGLSEQGVGVSDPAAAVAEAVHEATSARPGARALAVVRGVSERALAAHRRNRSGDNVAVAVLWMSGDGPFR